jgi:homoserine kinase type II
LDHGESPDGQIAFKSAVSHHTDPAIGKALSDSTPESQFPAFGRQGALNQVLDHYDLTPPVQPFALADAGINNRIYGVRTGAGSFLVKTYLANRDPVAIRYEHRLLAWLAQQGLSFATPVALPNRAGDTLWSATAGGPPQALFSYLPGEPLDRNNPTVIGAFGLALAELHTVLQGYPMIPVSDISDYAALGEIHPAVPNPDALTPEDLGLPDAQAGATTFAQWRALLDTVRVFIGGTYRELPRQVIHGDVGPGNAFQAGGRIVAIFDFEFAMPAVRAIDLAGGLTFVMRIWERDDATALAMAGHFCRGYRQGGVLTGAEIAALPQLMLLREVVGTIWWAGRNRAGTPQRKTMRIPEMMRLVEWLRRHETGFAAAVQ